MAKKKRKKATKRPRYDLNDIVMVSKGRDTAVMGKVTALHYHGRRLSWLEITV